MIIGNWKLQNIVKDSGGWGYNRNDPQNVQKGPRLGLDLWKDFKSLVGGANIDYNYTVALPS